MANNLKAPLLSDLSNRFGSIQKLDNSQSLFEIGDGAARIYIRYSKVHDKNRTFYGLRHDDLKQLEGFPAFLCFLWDGQKEPLFIPYVEYEEIFRTLSPAKDGQFKVQIYFGTVGDEFYIAGAGRFNIEANYGWQALHSLIDASKLRNVPPLSHPQIQTLLGAIGIVKGYEIWIPQNDRPKLDWSLVNRFDLRDDSLHHSDQIRSVLQEIDVVWLRRGSKELSALFEVEHSTPIYSGLLRFNDIHLAFPGLHPRYSIVASEERRPLFVKQLRRPTFTTSGLSDLCTFLEYTNVYDWFLRTGHKEIVAS